LQNDTLGGAIIVDPPFVEVAQDEVGKEFEVTVTNISDVPLTPRLVSGPYDVFEIDYSGKAIKPGGSTNMTVRVRKGNKVKTAKKSFTFEFDDAKRIRLTLAAQLLLEDRQAIKPTSNPGSAAGK
jgi:hypothetical protein